MTRPTRATTNITINTTNASEKPSLTTPAPVPYEILSGINVAINRKRIQKEALTLPAWRSHFHVSTVPRISRVMRDCGEKLIFGILSNKYNII
jgi:hypothetical protein